MKGPGHQQNVFNSPPYWRALHVRNVGSVRKGSQQQLLKLSSPAVKMQGLDVHVTENIKQPASLQNTSSERRQKGLHISALKTHNRVKFQVERQQAGRELSYSHPCSHECMSFSTVSVWFLIWNWLTPLKHDHVRSWHCNWHTKYKNLSLCCCIEISCLGFAYLSVWEVELSVLHMSEKPSSSGQVQPSELFWGSGTWTKRTFFFFFF